MTTTPAVKEVSDELMWGERWEGRSEGGERHGLVRGESETIHQSV